MLQALSLRLNVAVTDDVYIEDSAVVRASD